MAAGVVGCEYASIFANLGLKVNLVNVRERLLAFLDDEITDALGYHLRNQGVVIRNDEEYSQVEPLDDGVVLHCRSGKRFKIGCAAVGQRSHRKLRGHGAHGAGLGR